jgi:hypothetical protein
MIKKIILFSLVISQILTSCSSNDDAVSTETQLINKENLSKNEFPVCTTLEKTQNTGTTSKGNAVFKNNNSWITGQTIRIRFVGGSVELQNKIKEYASEWTSVANLNFVYVGANDESDASIFFETGSNYTFGRSINFGQLSNPNIPEDRIKGITLHEFGHLLGLQHENQNPAANIQWNKPAVYDYYQNVIGWSRDQVDSQIFNALPTSQYDIYTQYDSASVMTYSFPPSFTTDGFSVPFVSTLSRTDQMFIGKMFPYPIKSILYPWERLTTGARLTSPNGNYTLYIRSQKLILYSNTEFRDLGSITPNIKFSNALSSNVYLIISGNVIHLFKGSVSKTIGPNIPNIANIDYITLNNSGNIDAVINGEVKFSVNIKD